MTFDSLRRLGIAMQPKDPWLHHFSERDYTKKGLTLIAPPTSKRHERWMKRRK